MGPTNRARSTALAAILITLAASSSAAADRETLSKEMVIPPSPRQLAKLNALTPEGVALAIEMSGDTLEPVITLTTFKAYSSKGSFTDPVRSDNMLRAFIDRRTHEVRYQLYEEVSYNYSYRQFRSAVFATSAGPQSLAVQELEHEVVVCTNSLCSYRDVLGLSLPETLLREIAAQYRPGASPLWRFRFKARNGFDWEDRISPAEAAGLLLAVEKQLAAL